MLSDYFVLAFKNVRKRGIRSWLTMLGIFLGIAAVVSLISLGSGLKTAITGQFTSLSTNILTISSASTGFGPPGATAVRKLNDHDYDIIKNTPGVGLVIPRLIRIVRVEYNKILQFRYIGSIPNEQEQVDELVKAFDIQTQDGKFLKAGESGKIVLGNDFVKENSFDKKISIGSSITIQGKEFEVIGILKRASTFTLNSVVLMSEDDMKDILNIDDDIDLIVAKVDDEDNMESIAKEIERRFRKDRNQDEGEEDFSVQTPAQSISAVNSILNIVTIVVSGIALISLLIGGIGIANTMFTSVLERTKEIGIMKAIGARNRAILSVFIIEAGMLGLVGGIIGAGIGLLLAFSASSAANAALGETIIKVQPSYPLLFGSIAFSFVIGICSGIVPAYQASKLKIVDALRK